MTDLLFTTEGIDLPGEVAEVVDVRFDGRRVFSVNPAELDLEHGRRWVKWPDRLRKHLVGSSELTVAGHVTGDVLGSAEVRFTKDPQRVQVVDAEGRPLAVDKFGQLVRMFDSLSRETATDIAAKSDALARDMNEFGVLGFVAFGAMLGAVRNGRIIGHDMDVDVTYVSNYSEPADIAMESQRLEKFLRDKGWVMNRLRVGLMRAEFTDLDGDRRHIDVFVGCYRNGRLHLDRFVEADLPIEALRPLGTIELEGIQVLAPHDLPRLLEATYGPTYMTPDPSFAYKFTESRLRKSRAWFGLHQQRRNVWTGRLRRLWDESGPMAPSKFAEWALKRLPAGMAIVDVGSGVGSDALGYARAGHPVWAVDYSKWAVARLAEYASEQGLPIRPFPINLCDLRRAIPRSALLRQELRTAGLPCAVVSRGTLDLMDPEARQNFWLLCRALLGGTGGQLLLEFRTEVTKAGSHQPGFRPLNADRIIAEAGHRGGRVLETQRLAKAIRLVLEFDRIEDNALTEGKS